MSHAHLLLHARCQLAENPLWHRGAFYFVDILEGRVHRFDPFAKVTRVLQLHTSVGCLAPCANRPHHFLAGCGTGFHFLDLHTGALDPIADPEGGKRNMRFNDGKCDPQGRFLAGTMDEEETPGAGTLYRLDPDKRVTPLLRGVTISNGIAWPDGGAAMYYIDTPTHRIDAFDYDAATGGISNRRPAVEIPPEDGNPDGMTIDQEGNLWVALWGGGCVRCYDPRTGKLLDQVAVPATQVTSCCFGGEDYRTLFITTARRGLTPSDLADQPYAGGIFTCRPGAAGRPEPAFAG